MTISLKDYFLVKYNLELNYNCINLNIIFQFLSINNTHKLIIKKIVEK
jgi:hypothetical protein